MASLDDSVSSFVDVAASLNQALPQAGPISSTPNYLNAITTSSSHNIDGSSSSSIPGHSSSSSSARRDPADYADDDYDDDDDDDDGYPDNYSDDYNSEDSEDTDAEDDEYGESEDFRQRRNITYDFHPVHTPLNQIRTPMARTAGISQAAEDKTPLFLDVEPIGRQKIAFARLETWRNNLVGVSRYGFIFIADGVKIKVFKMLSSSRPELTLFTQLTPPKTNPPTRTQILGANNPMDLFCINSLRMGSLGGEEHFAVLTDAGQCHVYATSAILRGHDKEGAGERARDMLPIETLQVEKSAWGVDFHDRECLVAVSDNTRSITVFRLGIKEALENWDHGKAQRDHTRRRQETEDFDTDYSAGSDAMATASTSAAQATTDPGEASSSSGSSSRPKNKRTRGSDELRPHEPQNNRNLDLAKFKVRIVEAHDNNIPCIQFMDIPLRDSNGRVTYRACISSTAIDGDLKLWDVNTKECIASAAFPNKKGWHTKILWRHDFLNVANSDVITNVKRESFKTVDPVTLAHTETDPRLVLSFPTKSHNPYMNIFFRHQRHDSPFKIFDSAGTPLSAFETVIDSSTRPTMLSQERLDAEFLGVPTSQVSATPSAYLLHPTMSDKKRNETYIIDDLIVYHGSLYQTRLLDFSPDNGEMQLCNMCPTVFGTRVDYEKFSASYDRLNMAITIRELACIIVASQQGSVSIFKCCRVDDTRQAGLRQEYVIGSVKNSGSTNPLIGLDVAVVDSQADAYHRRYLLFVVFINGTVETYEIGRSRNAASGDDVLDFEEHVF